MGVFKVANDYLTKEEQVRVCIEKIYVLIIVSKKMNFKEAFKKPKKIIKKLRKAVKADDLVPLEEIKKPEKPSSVDKTILNPDIIKVEKAAVTLKDVNFDFQEEVPNEDSETWVTERQSNAAGLNDDEAFEDLHMALKKIRNKKLSNKINEITKQIIEERDTTENIKIEEENDLKKQMTLDTMSEFCRNLGKSDRVKRSNNDDSDEDVSAHTSMKIKVEENKHDDNDEKMEFDDYDDDNRDEDDEVTVKKEIDTDQNAILDDEPIVDRGLASAIKLAVNKGKSCIMHNYLILKTHSGPVFL